MKTVYIMRGLPGSGKSTKAQVLQNAKGNGAVICSADNYFMVSGNYVFNAKELSNAHSFCRGVFETAMQNGVDTIIVDNTNIKRRDFQYYIDAAKRANYQVEEVIVGEFTKEAVETYVARNIHKVPREAITRMAMNFQK